MSFLILKTLHILSAIILFGVGLGTVFYKIMADRSGNLAAIAVTSRQVVLADWLFTTPAVIFQPLSGMLMASQVGYGLDTPWLVATYWLYILTGACWLPVVMLQIRMRDLAEKGGGKTKRPASQSQSAVATAFCQRTPQDRAASGLVYNDEWSPWEPETIPIYTNQVRNQAF